MFRKILIALGVLIFSVWAFNTSAFIGPPEEGATLLLAHRGVHQTYSRENLGIQDCTATRIYKPEHDLLENTLPSMRAAFEAGADIVEIDIHWTKDKHFAVFHDWGLACRTEASGKIETFTRAELKALDIGYGYTADEGATYPFRGQHVGAMPMLEDVFEAFPDKQILVNLKSNNREEGEAFGEVMRAHPDWLSNVYGFYGGPRSVAGAAGRLPGHIGFSRQSTKACLKDYVLWGWTGGVPESCQNTQLLVPVNYARYLWGWPHKLTRRMKAAGSDVLLAGPYNGRSSGSTGINWAEDAALIPDGFDGYIWTDHIERLGPLVKGVEVAGNGSGRGQE